MSEQQVVLSLAWFQREEWQKLKETVDDPDTLDDTYEDWRKNAENTIRIIRESGQHIQKISIKIDALVEWCNENQLKPDGKARSQYAVFLAQQRIK